MVTVLVVDDSAFARATIARRLKTDPAIEVVGFARDGLEAVEQTKKLRPDVVSLDVQMPRLDGLAALERIIAECPTPVVMVSSVTGEQTEATVKALEAGAVDFFLKPSLSAPEGLDNGRRLTTIVKLAATISVNGKPRFLARTRPASASAARGARRRLAGRGARGAEKVLVIGSSTGGPRALSTLIPELPADLPAAVLIVQHMPPGFTTSLANRLNQSSALEVREAGEGDAIRQGAALVAPGDYHMTVDARGRVRLDQRPQVHGVRPSVDVTMKSVARAFGARARGVILTGMGSDGADGAAAIKAVDGKVAAEHESSCAVYGMPRSVIEAGYADRVAPLRRMAREVVELCAG